MLEGKNKQQDGWDFYFKTIKHALKSPWVSMKQQAGLSTVGKVKVRLCVMWLGSGPEMQDQAVVVSVAAKLCHVLPGSRGHLLHT